MNPTWVHVRLGDVATPPSTPPDHTFDVAVVGAGIAGLVAARQLAALGLDVVVLEAHESVGGRTRSAQVAGVTVDLGGTFVGPTQDRVIALAAALGCRTHPTWVQGKSVVRWHGSRRRYSGTIPRVPVTTLLNTERVRLLFDRAANRLGADGMGRSEQDEISLGTWLTRVRAGQGATALLAAVARTTWGCEPDEVSLLHALRYVKGCGGINRMLDTEGGAQQDHFAAGAQEMSLRMAAELNVYTACPVRSVRHTAGEDVVLETPHGDLVARAVVVAVPPAMRNRIVFDPPLPSGYQALSQRWPQGALTKAYAVYEKPFWRDDNLSGQTLSDDGPVFITLDASPEDASRGALLGFIGGDYARRFDALPQAERRLQVLQCFAELFGPAALQPLGYIDQRWASEPWIGGGPTAHPGPGALTGYGRWMAEPVGRIHWAGTETADVWSGFMDGAVRSGERAATEVAAHLAVRTTDDEMAANA
ncbi:MAG: monoamine oxidase [Frankiales bacterium]|nr:monoamine oxidase [Frankiales bacterium]